MKALRKYKERPWIARRFESQPGSATGGLRLSVDVLQGGARIVAGGRSDEKRYSYWQIWLEIYLAPSERVPASIPLHRITGSLEISGLASLGFDYVSLETAYDLPPDVLGILFGRKTKAKQVVVSSPIPAILAACCQTPEWVCSQQAHEDAMRFKIEVAEADYHPLEIVAPLAQLQYSDSTEWRLRSGS